MKIKKLSGCLCAASMLFVLGGCKDALAGVSNAKSTIVSVGDTDITKGSIYEVLKANNGSSTTLSLVLKQVFENEGIKVDDDMKKRAEEDFKESLKSSDVTEKEMLKQLKSYGYDSKEAYFEAVFYPNYQQEALNKKYVQDKKKSVFNTYSPVKARVMKTSEKEDAEKALKDLKAGKDFEATAKKYGDTSTYTGKEDLYISESGLPDTVFAKISNVTDTGLIESVIEDTTSESYYIAEVTETDTGKFEEEAIDEILTSAASSLKEKVIPYYLKKNEFKIYDIDIYDAIKSTNEAYIVQD